MLRCAKILRVATVPPISALVMLVLLYVLAPGAIGGAGWLLAAVFCLTALPLLAYPLQPAIPGFRDKGREGQRTLAMIFSVAGYVAGCAAAFIARSPVRLKIIFLTYLFSGILIVLLNKIVGIKASGHACGMTGPLAILIFYGVYWAAPGILLLAAVWWSSLKTRRHTAVQLAAGTAVPVAALLAAAAVMGAF